MSMPPPARNVPLHIPSFLPSLSLVFPLSLSLTLVFFLTQGKRILYSKGTRKRERGGGWVARNRAGMREKRRSGSHPPSLLLFLCTSSFSFFLTITRKEWLVKDWLDLRLDSWKWDGAKRKTGERLNEKKKEIERGEERDRVERWMDEMCWSFKLGLFHSRQQQTLINWPIPSFCCLSPFFLSFSLVLCWVFWSVKMWQLFPWLFLLFDWQSNRYLHLNSDLSPSLSGLFLSFLPSFDPHFLINSLRSLSLLPILDLNQDRKRRRET